MGETDNSWVFDSLVCFLSGPIWNAPLQSFIEEKSLTFEANAADNDDYKNIFEEYKNLVDLMLSSYMDDIGISALQFEEACNKGHLGFLPKHFNQNLFEQIWAANDYGMFKQMMIQRNIELQLQALELIEKKYGITPQSYIPHGPSSSSNTSDTKAQISEECKKTLDLEDTVMEEVIKKFPLEDDSKPEQELTKVDEEVQYLMEEKQILQDTLKSIEKKSKTPKVVQISESAPQLMEKEKTETKADLDKTTESEILLDNKPVSTEIDRVELKKRQEYLRAQRDKLVALKKEARKKQLNNENGSSDKLKNRPKSAKVAEAVMSGDTANVEHQQLQVRKALAERLRSEVISNKSDE